MTLSRDTGEQTVTGLTQTEIAYSVLRREIMSCKVMPGTKLRINEIAPRLGVSVSAVREALSRLSMEELVVATAQKGFSVSALTADEIRDITRTRISIETLCLVDSLKNGGVEWESRIIAAFHTLSRTPYGHPEADEAANEQWSRAHASFHTALVSACTSRSLLKIRAALYDQSERYRQLSGLVPRGDSRNVEAEHKGLMDAALARDDNLIAERIGEHFSKTMSAIITAF
jgi:GntR family transcriptional regulator, carbon starvation induced regulator